VDHREGDGIRSVGAGQLQKRNDRKLKPKALSVTEVSVSSEWSWSSDMVGPSVVWTVGSGWWFKTVGGLIEGPVVPVTASS
jgi:hypothetical protein